jgi:hypothetical protein
MSQAVAVPKVRSKPPPQARDWLKDTSSRLAELSAGVTGCAPETILIQPETALPRGLDIGLRRLFRWNFVVADTWWLERRLREAGWHFFFMVPAITTGAFAFDRSRALRKAQQHLIGKVEARNLNAVQITEVHIWRFWPLHYARIVAHTRHIRNSPFLRDLDPQRRSHRLWDFKGIFRIRNRKAREQIRQCSLNAGASAVMR